MNFWQPKTLSVVVEMSTLCSCKLCHYCCNNLQTFHFNMKHENKAKKNKRNSGWRKTLTLRTCFFQLDHIKVYVPKCFLAFYHGKLSLHIFWNQPLERKRNFFFLLDLHSLFWSTRICDKTKRFSCFLSLQSFSSFFSFLPPWSGKNFLKSTAKFFPWFFLFFSEVASACESFCSHYLSTSIYIFIYGFESNYFSVCSTPFSGLKRKRKIPQ